MIFQNGRFCPEFIPDPWVRQLLCTTLARSTLPVQGVDILGAAIEQGDSELLASLGRAVMPGSTLEDVRRGIEAVRPSRGGLTSSFKEEAFSSPVLEAIVEFDTIFRTDPTALASHGPALLVCCILLRLDEQERRMVSGLDVQKAAAILHHQVTQAMAGSDNSKQEEDETNNEEEAQDGPLLLPPELAASEDLTFLAQTAGTGVASPFEGVAQFDVLFDAIARILHRRRNNHVLLTGERGVGKNTILSELARRAAVGKMPFLGRRRFLRVDCRFIPSDESRQRLGAILSHVAGRPELIVCLDGFASLLRGERAGTNKAALLAGLARAHCQLIGSLTPREYEEFFSDDADFGEFFARVDVEEPEIEVALGLLCHFARGLSQKYRVEIDPEAVRQAVLLSHNYILHDHLPAKALNVLHSICEDIDFERSQLASGRVRIGVDDVVRCVSARSGVPEETLHGVAERSDYESSLREVIFGQDHAVREVATELGLIKAGMTDPDKPASVMMFLGQTGTGKTEMAKALARFYSTSKRLKTYTLGNCVEPHSVATIIGVPPGYVGSDRGGRLVNELNADPYCVFLLDEADKAHPDVLQPFLNLFDEGWVTDQRGVRGYANKSIFILTTNVGQRMIAEMVQEGKSMEEIVSRMREALSQIRHTKSDRPVFTPEFLARIKRILVFYPLDARAMAGICRKLIRELQESWQAKRGKRLEVPESLSQLIAEQSHQINEKSKGKEGGRIVRKLIAEWIEAAVQRETSLQPAEYRACGVVALEHLPADPPANNPQAAPLVRVRFQSE